MDCNYSLWCECSICNDMYAQDEQEEVGWYESFRNLIDEDYEEEKQLDQLHELDGW